MLFAMTEEKWEWGGTKHLRILFESLQIVGRAEKLEPVGQLLLWSSTLAQCQTQSSAVGMGVDAKMLDAKILGGGGVCLLLFNYKGRENLWSHLTGEHGNGSFLTFFSPSELLQSLLLLITLQSSSQLKWMNVVVCLVLASGFWTAARYLLVLYCCHMSII